MTKIKSHKIPDELQIIRKLIIKLFRDDLILRSIYLYDSRYNSTDNLFKMEDMAQFIIKFLIKFIDHSATGVQVPEQIVDLLLGLGGTRVNAIEATLRANFANRELRISDADWKNFYYLNILPNRSLFHLTNRSQKLIAAQTCRDEMQNSSKHIEDTISLSKTHSKTYITSYYSPEALKCLTALTDDTISSEKRTVALTIFGFHRSLMGIGEDARRLFDILTRLGYRVELVNCAYPDMEEDPSSDYYKMFETLCPIAEIAVFCMPLFEMGKLVPRLTKQFFETRYTVGYWPWELTALPIGWREIAGLVDEVWASSNFLRDVFRREYAGPIHLVPLCVILEPETKPNCNITRENKENATFISVFDFNSSIQRKNPLAAIKAFKLAFPLNEAPKKLLLKSINGSQNLTAKRLLESEIGNDRRITLIDGFMSRHALNTLIAEADAFISLHRSEGFGRLLAESMLLGVPVIATDWSGSCDFIKQDHAFPVRYQLVDVNEGDYPYAAGQWAEPDLLHAAEIMRYVADSIYANTPLVENASRYISNNFSYEAISKIIHQRVEMISKLLEPSKAE